MANPMITDVDTCLREIADWYIEKRRELTEPELEAILLKHCEDEAEVRKFVSFLETEPGQLRFKTLLRERKEKPSQLQAEPPLLEYEKKVWGYIDAISNPEARSYAVDYFNWLRGYTDTKPFPSAKLTRWQIRDVEDALKTYAVGLRFIKPGPAKELGFGSVEDNAEVYTSEVLPPEVAQGAGLHRDLQVDFRYTTYYYGPDLKFFQRDLERLLRERTGIPYLAVDAYYIRPSPSGKPSYLKETSSSPEELTAGERNLLSHLTKATQKESNELFLRRTFSDGVFESVYKKGFMTGTPHPSPSKRIMSITLKGRSELDRIVPKAEAGTRKERMPRIDPHASAIQQDKQLVEQMKWLKTRGFKTAREAQEAGY